ncbi:CDP-diacylglycerol--serine O-phosphatidyltransferase [Marinobacter nanhaiticus D15-8W]|uniref:CDP-diacylglycerol--serine O-phosphatidyltransferase n=1 Tax=Marinobacter nanhaiticus D15-8W TaxID=626887 RepID=N6W1N5_9GAMM|nr:CDP-diacylglycerol--serine O-phosphatidyltransferase [Marinobacter nanhaiticus]ENO16435.1 CDP-diacylglycerol--serine O-phosphatidyltransferase [Marinobacter nanhaiticus D15-8W]BES72704.1 CDP-diacylglycerol--serine O-phosphatidyltransferase [Marinobacter nanhaiticus D15-8W]
MSKTNRTDDNSVSAEEALREGEVVEEEVVEGARVRRKGIYLLPNLLTTASLFSGFFAMVSAANGMFENAAIAIFVSMVLDGLDGRVARMTNTQSKFGEEYDSLADMVAFGVAPGLVAFFWSLNSFGQFGWAITFIYVAGAALRLARFNTQIGSVDKKYFVGLPSPSAAAVVAGLVWCFQGVEPEFWLKAMTVLVVGGAGVLMVSNILYRSFKDLDLKGRVPFAAILVVVLVFVVVTLDPGTVLFAGFLVYGLSGPARALFRKVRRPRPQAAEGADTNKD